MPDPHTVYQHNRHDQKIQQGNRRQKSALFQFRLIFPVRRKHIDDLCLSNRPGVEKSHNHKAQRKKDNGQKYGVREQHPGNPITLPVGYQQHGSDKLGAEGSQKNSGGHRDSSHEKSLRKKEPSDSPLFHSHNGLQGKFLLPAPQHVTVHKPDQKQKDQRDGADGHLHPVAKHREIIGTSDVGMIVTAGDGQEGIKQCDTDRHGHYIDQVIPDGPLGVSKNQLCIHGSVHLRS